MDEDEHFISKMLTWFSRVSCHQEEVTTDNLYSGAVLADFLSTFDMSFFTEEWHDEILFADRNTSAARIACIKSIYSKLCDFYIAKLSRHLVGSQKWKINPEQIAIELNRRELAKLLIIIVFVAGTKPNFAEKLQLVFDEVELAKLVEKLGTFNNDVPAVCDDDRKVLLDLVEQNNKERQDTEKKTEKLNKKINDLISDKELMEEEYAQLKRDHTLLKDKCDSMAAIIEQHNTARRQFEDTYANSYSIEKQLHCLQADLNELRFKNRELETDLLEKTNRLELIQEESLEIIDANRQLQEEVTKLRKQQIKNPEPKTESKEEELLKMRLENYIAEVTKLRGQVTEIEALKAHAANLQLINDDFERRLSEMTERCHESIAENSSLRRKLEDVESSINFTNVSKNLSMVNMSGDESTISLHDELNSNCRSLSFYEDKLTEIEKENAILKAKLDNVARQHSNLLSIKEESDEQRKTSTEVLQAKLNSYIMMCDDAETKLRKMEEEHNTVTLRLNEQQIEIERLKGELAQNSKLLKEKEQALQDYVELHIQTNEALGSTSIFDEAKLKLDFVEMKVKLDRLTHELKSVTAHRDSLIQEQRLIASSWYQLMLERHGDATSRELPGNKIFPDDPSSLPSRSQTAMSGSSASTEPSNFFRSASKRFPRLFRS